MLVEMRRKLLHILLGFILAILIYGRIITPAILLLITIVFFLMLLLSKNLHIPLFSWFLDNFERKCDLSWLPGKGPLFYLIGVLVVYSVFPLDIALASIMVLALGDSLSYVVGQKFGRTISPLSDKKFLEGALAGIVAATLGAMIFVSWYEALFAATAAMFVEAIDIQIRAQKVDDNLIIPIVAAFVIWLLRAVVSS